MAKARIKYVCGNCGYSAPKGYGRCPNCGEFNTMEEVLEEVAPKSTKATVPRTGGSAMGVNSALRLADVNMDMGARHELPVKEFSRVLGGGIVPGSIILLGGAPGIGKSTLLLQMSALLANTIGRVLYVSGEESTRQIKMRAERLNTQSHDLFLLTETNLSSIMEQVRVVDPVVLIVDSIQTVYTDEIESSPGNVAQVRECASRLQTFAKSAGVSVFLVGHVTKEGSIAGPRLLEHIVDTVLYLEGDPFQHFRLLRSVKNRFGATSEVGVFEMQGEGMVEVPNPSEAFLAERVISSSGSTIAVTMEGTRPLLVEIQALTSQTSFGNPRRTPNGVDLNRLLLISAVLGKRVGFKLHEQDIFINVIGGLKVSEPASDLAMAVSIASSYLDRVIPADMVVIGEVGLSGEIRTVSQLGARLSEAQKLGFKRALVPRTRRQPEGMPKGLELIPIRNVAEALKFALPDK
jgi:DNA repair protein RadA/Sms